MYNSGQHGWILASHNTVKGVACETTGRNPGEFHLHSVPGCTIDTKSHKNVFSRISGRRNAILLCLHFCCMNNGIIITKSSIFSQKRGVYELTGCTNS